MGRIGGFIEADNPGATDADILARDELAHALMYFSRVDRAANREYLVVTNNATGAVSVTVPPLSDTAPRAVLTAATPAADAPDRMNVAVVADIAGHTSSSDTLMGVVAEPTVSMTSPQVGTTPGS